MARFVQILGFAIVGLLATRGALAASVGFDPIAATDAYIATLPPDAIARSNAYFEGGNWLILWDFLYSAAISWLLLASGFAARLRGAGRWPFFVTALWFGFIYIVVSTILAFPLDAYEGFFRERQYGLMNQSFLDWFIDHLTELGVNAVMMAVFIAVLYSVIRAAPRTWWIWGAGVSVCFLAVLMLIAPVFIMPLFNHYQSMRPGPVRESILSMARSNGVPATDVLEFDASRQSDKVSANVSGFLGTTRISLTDNLLTKASPAGVRAVMAHEMGHYVLNHATKMLMEFGLLTAFGFAFIGVALPWVLARHGARWGVTGVGDVAGVPLLFFLFSLFFLVATPIKNTIIRAQEAEADMFGLNLAREPDGFAEAALLLSRYRKMSPGPWEEIIFYDHPSGRHRILRAMTWKAENLPPPSVEAAEQ